MIVSVTLHPAPPMRLFMVFPGRQSSQCIGQIVLFLFLGHPAPQSQSLQLRRLIGHFTRQACRKRDFRYRAQVGGIIVELMAGQKTERNSVRQPAFAGMFYPAQAQACSALARSFVLFDSSTSATPAAGKTWLGGIVPHAGWICSGAIAGQTIGTLARQGSVDVVVVFGAIHTALPTDRAALDPHGHWQVPGGDSALPDELISRLTESSATLFAVDERFHRHEHAIEVELPLIQAAWPNAMVLPVEVPVVEQAQQIGAATARAIESAGLSAVYLASSDLTHYGPNYRFCPVGVGSDALEWAKENDRRVLDLVCDMQPDRIVPEVMERQNACGGGAIAAMLAACREHGAAAGTVLRHANSYETLAEVAPQRPDNAVGYAAVVVG